MSARDVTERSTPVADVRIDEDGALASTPHGEVGILPWVVYLAAGTMLGVVFMQAEVLSWYRIQEMFRFQSVHMYGVIAVAITVAAISQAVLRRLGVRALSGEVIDIPPKRWTPTGARYAFGGLVFGLGWALLGACPGPIFALIGAGHSVYLVSLLAAVAGTYLYGAIRHRLPH
jgi:uncharacterized protein